MHKITLLSIRKALEVLVLGTDTYDKRAFITKQPIPIPIEREGIRKPRRPGLLTFVLAFLLLGFGTSIHAQADFEVDPATNASTINVNDTFFVTLQVVSSGQQYDLAEAYLSFDPAILEVVSLTPQSTSVLPLPLVPAAFDNFAGTLQYGASTFSNFPSSGIDLLQIEFRALATGTSTLDFFDPAGPPSTIITFGGSSVLGTATGGSYTVGTSDNTPPVIALLGDNPLELTVGDTYVEPGATANDDIDGDISGNIVIDNSAVNTAAEGSYQVTYNVMDAAGNPATEVIRVVNVNPVVVTMYTITASAGAGGTISPSGAVSVNAGDDQTFTITPDAGFEISEVLIDGNPIGPTASFEFANVLANATISASFGAIPFQLCIASGSDALNAFGMSFEADSPASPNAARTGGSFFTGYSGTIAGTTPGSDEELLFQKEVFGGNGGANNALYSIPVPGSGFYRVDIYFAEVFHPNAGGRIFDVFLEGNLMLDEYDLVDPTKDGLPSNQTAITRTYFVQISDGSVEVQIGPASTDNGKISGLCVTEVTSANLHPTSSIGNLNFEALLAVSSALNLNDPENDDLTVVLNGLPASLSYNNGTDLLEGTPQIADIGSYTINAIISDGNSSPITEEFTLTIDPSSADMAPTIAAIDDINVAEGGTASTSITITDDNNVFNTSFVLYDKSNPIGSTNNPITPSTVIDPSNYTFTDNGGGSYSFSWLTSPGDGRSYLARLTTDDGVNPPVEALFSINVGQPIPATVQAKTFSNPLPWYATSPQAPFSIIIENNGAQNIGFIDNGEFAEYLIDVPSAGEYVFALMGAKNPAGVTNITLSEINGGIDTPGVVGVVNNGGGWQDYAEYTANVVFNTSGLQTIRLDFGGPVNVSEFSFTPAPDTSPTIDPIADVEIDEGGTLNLAIQVNDNLNPAATIVIYDKSAPGGNNAPYTPAATIAGFTFTEGTPGAGDYTLNWPTSIGDGRSYEARLTANDGVNPPVEAIFKIDVAQDIPDVILARTFANPLPWYGNSPAGPAGQDFSVSIEGAGNIGWINNNDFVEYLIDVPAPGDFNLRINASKGSGDSGLLTISEESGGGFNPIGNITVIQNGWTNFADYNTTVTFANAGLQTLRFDFNGGMNINEFEFVDPNANQAPAVTITAPVDGFGTGQNVSVNFTGTAIDPEEGDISTSLEWSSSINGPLGTGASINTAILSIGSHTITASATDTDPTDPLTGTATIIVNVFATAPNCDVRFRVNAGGDLYADAGGNFEEDRSAANAGGSAQTGTPSTYVDTSVVDNTFGSTAALVSNATGYADILFQTERWSDAENPNNMQWSFPTGDGVFDVKILFNENWTGEITNPRVFDVEIEGALALDDYRPSGPSGADVNVAKVETYQATVTDGVLNIDFIKGTQNPSVKGFDICFVSDLPNDTPIVNITAPSGTEPITVERGVLTTFSATATDTEDDDATLTAAISWSIDPFEPSFGGSGGSFDDQLFVPGDYTVTASATDSGGETGTDEVMITIPGPDVDFTAPMEGANLATTEIQFTWTAANMIFTSPFDEHFHLYVNPADPNNLNPADRISTASQSGQLFWDLGAAEGIVDGPNTVVIVAAEGIHTEFTNPEARDVVNFTVCSVSIDDLAITDPSDCAASDGQVVVTASGTNLEYSNDGGATFQASNTFSGLSAGSYNIVVRSTDDNSCSDNTTAILTDPAAPTIDDVAVNDLSDCDSDDGQIVITATGTNLEYSIDNGATFQNTGTFPGLAMGSYDIVVREFGAQNCLATTTANVGGPVAPEITNIVETDPTDCGASDGQIDITATGSNLEYSIDGPGGLQSNGTGNFAGLAAGVYNVSVVIIDTGNCVASGTATLTDPTVPTINNVTGTDPTDCGLMDGTITIDASGTNLEYSIDGGTTFLGNNVFTGLGGGSYDIAVREAGTTTCNALSNVVLTAPAAPSIASIESSGPTDCGGSDGSLAILATGVDLEYSIDGGSTFQTDNSFAGLTMGTYDIVVREVGTMNCAVTAQHILSDPAAPAITNVAVVNNTDCNVTNGQITITATGSNLEYSIGGAFQPSNVFSGLAAGDYTVTVRRSDANSCSATQMVSITAPEAPMITNIDETDPTTCSGTDGQIIVTATGSNLDYSISGPVSQSNGTGVFTGLPAGAYTISVVVIDTGNCEANGNANLNDPASPNPVISGPLSYLEGTGGVMLDAGAGFSSYSWSPGGETTQTITALAGSYTVTVVDANGCSGTSASVTVTEIPDDELPVITCPADISVNNDPAACSAIIVLPDPTATDNVSTEFIFDGIRSDGMALTDPFPVGTTTITWTAEDEAGNVSLSCDQLVTVTDNEAPNAVCQNITVQLDASGNASITAGDVDGGSSDNCAVASISIDNSSFNISNVGANTVNLTVTDVNGNSSSCSATVTVEDNVAPIAICQNTTVQLDANGIASITAADIDNGSNDAAGIASLSVSPNSFTCADLGPNTVTLTVTDNNGNVSSCTATVTVEDNIPPEIDCPANIVMVSPTPLVLPITPPTPTDNCGVDGLIATRSDGDELTDPFPLGITTITWQATDIAGNPAMCQQTVTISAPLSGANDILAFDVPNQVGDENIDGTGKTVELTVPFGTDVSALTPTIAISAFATVNPMSGVAQNFSSPVQYTVTAENGDPQQWTVTVNVATDMEDPVVTCPADIVVSNDPGQCGANVNFSPSATDNSGSVTVSASPMSGTFFPVGTTQVTVTATDDAGNSVQCMFNVTVNDTEPPSITCPADIVVSALPGDPHAFVGYSLPVGSDNCPGVSVMQTAGLPAGATFPIGTTTNTFEAMDAAGNMMSCSFDVTVNPAPSLTITPSSMSVTLKVGEMEDVFYVVNSDDGSTLPTPAAMKIIDEDTGTDATWAATTSAANQNTSYEVGFNATGLTPGTYTGELMAGPVTGYFDASIPITMIVEPAVGTGELIVLDATTDTPLFDLEDGMIIPKTQIGETPLGIIYNTNLMAGGMKFTLTGPINRVQNEGPTPPQSLFGDIGDDVQGQPFPIGLYTLVADPVNGPTITVNFEVSDVDPNCVGFDAFLSDMSDTSSCGASDGAISIDVNGGTGPYTYSWSHDGGLNSSLATGLAAGIYTVTVTDQNNCTDTVTVTISDPDLPTVTLAPFANVLDTDPPFALTGGSPAGGTYSGPGVSSGMFDPSIGTGTYPITYTFTDGNGCSNSAVQNITVGVPVIDADLIVLDATTDTPLFGLTDGMQINKNDIGNTPLGIIYNEDLNPVRVKFILTGPINETRNEGPNPPYSLFGDIGVNIQGMPFPVGDYTLSANPKVGPTIVVNFSVIDGPPVNQPPNAVASATPDATTAFEVDFSSAGSNDPDGMIVSYDWNFGDTNTSTQQNPTHTYAAGGSYTVTLKVTDNEGAMDTATIQVEAVDPNDVDMVVSFVLVDAVTNNDIMELSNNIGFTENEGINIRANTDPGVVGSVKMQLSGPVNKMQTESFAPYALYGDNAGNYNLANLPPGDYTLTATPFSQSGGNGDAGLPLTIDFTVIDAVPMPLARVEQEDPVSVHPNPADRLATMEFEEPVRLSEIYLYDVTGKLVKVINADTGEDVNTYLLRVQDLPEATYYVRIRDAEGKEMMERVVIKR